MTLCIVFTKKSAYGMTYFFKSNNSLLKSNNYDSARIIRAPP